MIRAVALALFAAALSFVGYAAISATAADDHADDVRAEFNGLYVPEGDRPDAELFSAALNFPGEVTGVSGADRGSSSTVWNGRQQHNGRDHLAGR